MIIKKVVSDQFMVEDRPLIAICLAAYNGEKYITQQLESIFSQTYQHFKLYIADDRSTDRTVEIIETFQNRFTGRIGLTVNDKQLGVVNNFETLIGHCKEEYIACCDQDDIWESNKLELQLKAMRQLEEKSLTGACLVHSDLSMVNENAEELEDSYFRFRGYRLNQKKDLGHILGPSGVMGNTLMINAVLRDKVLPFPSGLEVHDYHDYWIGVVAELYGERKTLQQPLVRYRIHNSNLSNPLQKVQSKGSRWGWLNRDIRLPYLDSKRYKVMAALLEKELSQEDEKYIQAFYDYLTFSKSRLAMFSDLIRYSLVKRGIWFRMKLLAKMMLTKRYPDA